MDNKDLEIKDVIEKMEQNVQNTQQDMQNSDIEIKYDIEQEIPQEPQGTLLSVVLDDNGYVQQFCTGGMLGDETTHFYTEIPQDFFEHSKAYRVEDETLVLDTKQTASVEEENELNQIRGLREMECFSVINRGKLWYDRLTDEQYKELSDWYDDWLNVTERKRGAKSFSIPQKPEWLN